MKRMYEIPVMQEDYANVTIEILVSSHIGVGGDGQEGDVKECNLDSWEDEDD